MRAARYYGKEDIRIEDVEQQECGAGQVRVTSLPFWWCRDMKEERNF